MIRKTGKWDVRVPKSIKKLFPDRSKPYYWMVNRDKALAVVRIMAKAYKIHMPKVIVNTKLDCNALYHKDKIHMHTRNHIKSIMHEFYHHLDRCTHGLYNSSDNKGGKSSLSWKFADLWWVEFKKLY